MLGTKSKYLKRNPYTPSTPPAAAAFLPFSSAVTIKRISYQDTNYRRSIPAEEHLSICLRFLATGDSYRTIAGSFRAGISTVSMLIPDVVAAIWDCLVEEFMAVPGAEEWR
uniref:Transposase Helix-turn-helix domain-containing protein n=1 Tax=Knipowitschia caucasica TaxID=637954 RepID=A0AAV2JI03_KNICA